MPRQVNAPKAATRRPFPSGVPVTLSGWIRRPAPLAALLLLALSMSTCSSAPRYGRPDLPHLATKDISPAKELGERAESAELGPLRGGNEDLEAGDRWRTQVSWYGEAWHGKRTASGEIFNLSELSAAHRKLPFGTWLQVTNLSNGKSVNVRVNDRGPFKRGRSLDVSKEAARQLGFLRDGTTQVEVRVLSLP